MPLALFMGQKVIWLPETLRMLREEAPDIEIALYSHTSPDLARALMRERFVSRADEPAARVANKESPPRGR